MPSTSNELVSLIVKTTTNRGLRELDRNPRPNMMVDSNLAMSSHNSNFLALLLREPKLRLVKSRFRLHQSRRRLSDHPSRLTNGTLKGELLPEMIFCCENPILMAQTDIPHRQTRNPKPQTSLPPCTKCRKKLLLSSRPHDTLVRRKTCGTKCRRKLRHTAPRNRSRSSHGRILNHGRLACLPTNRP